MALHDGGHVRRVLPKRDRIPEFAVDIASITPAMLDALAFYRARAFYVNTALSQGSQADAETKASITDLTACIRCCRVTRPGIVWRGVADMSPALHRVGDIHQTVGFLSTSKDRDIAVAHRDREGGPLVICGKRPAVNRDAPDRHDCGGGLFPIRVPTGMSALDFCLMDANGVDDEAEVLFGPGTVFEVRGVKEDIVDLASTGIAAGAPDLATVVSAARKPVRYGLGSPAPQQGLVTLLLARGDTSDLLAIDGFLIDMRRGLRDAYFRIDDEAAFKLQGEAMGKASLLVSVDPGCARKRLREVVAWLRPRGSLRTGIFAVVEQLFGDVNADVFASADAFVVDMKGEVRDGIHIARSKSVTVADAGAQWIKTAEANVERATLSTYQAVLKTHCAVHRPDEVIGPVCADGARVRGQASRGGALADHGEAGPAGAI